MRGKIILLLIFLVAIGKASWASLEAIQITGETLSSPEVFIDHLKNSHLIFLSENKNLKLKRLYYASGTTLEPRVIFETFDNIINPKIIFSPWAVLLFWQKEYAGRKESYLTISLNGGKNFGPVKLLPPGVNFTTEAFPTIIETPTIAGLDLPPLEAPEILSPANKSITRQSSPEIIFRPAHREPAIYKIEISPDENFLPRGTWGIDYLDLYGSPEISYRLPIELPDGRYWLRIFAFDGLSVGFSSYPIEFKIDSTPPLLTITSPSSEGVEEGDLLLEGTLSEPAQLCLNGKILTPEASGTSPTFKFKARLSLLPGKNLITLSATDEAGNSILVSKTLTYSSFRPQIKVLKPGETDWFKPGSTIYIEAEVYDLQDDIEDESEGDLIISDKTMEDRLSFDKSSGKLSGFINLPKEIPDGKIPAKIRLADAAGNIGEAKFTLNIDRFPPIITLPAGEPAFSNSSSRIAIPVLDAGAGIDPAGTILKIAGVSFEGQISIEASSTEAQKLFIKTPFPLSDGIYEVTIVPRDKIGNTGKNASFNLIIDTVPPDLKISSPEVNSYSQINADQKKFLVEGEAQDDYFASVEILNNLQKVAIFSTNKFTYEVPLFPGNNIIEIIAADRAGNKKSQTLQVFSKAAASTIITDFGNGPNPFSPKNGEEMQFVYKLSDPANLKIYLFDLTGTLIWKKELTNATSGTTFWDGRDHFGKIVDNGVYPYLIQASSSGTTEIRRGKIIVY